MNAKKTREMDRRKKRRAKKRMFSDRAIRLAIQLSKALNIKQGGKSFPIRSKTPKQDHLNIEVFPYQQRKKEKILLRAAKRSGKDVSELTL